VCLACDKVSAVSRHAVLDCVLYMYAASTVRVSSLFEAGNSADLCILEDLALDLAANRHPRWPSKLRQQSDVDQTVAAASAAALNNADDSSPDLLATLCELELELDLHLSLQLV